MLKRYLKNGLILVLVCTLLPVNVYAESGVVLEGSTETQSVSTESVNTDTAQTEDLAGVEVPADSESIANTEEDADTSDASLPEGATESVNTYDTEELPESGDVSDTEASVESEEKSDAEEPEQDADSSKENTSSLEGALALLDAAVSERADSDAGVPATLESDVEALGISASQKLSPSSATVADVVAVVRPIIYTNELGSGWSSKYGAVNTDDNGALSIGILQWHGSNALTLLQLIMTADDALTKGTLGTDLYNKVKDGSISEWSVYKPSEGEATAIGTLISTTVGKSVQDSQAEVDIYEYMELGYSTYGITNAAALAYFCDLKNQCGTETVKRIVTRAIALADGSVSSVTLNELHEAALMDSVAGDSKYWSRRFLTYSSIADAATSKNWNYYNSGSYRIPAPASNSAVGTSSSSLEIKWLQWALNTSIQAGLDVDGGYGSLTAAAVKSFQTKYQTTYGLTVDGYAGQMTITALINVITDFTATFTAAKPVLGSASNTTSGVKVTWSKLTGADGYYVYRKTGTGGYSKIGTVTSSSTLSYTDQTAASGTTYTYTVRGYSGDTKSDYNSTGVSVLYLKSPDLSSVSASVTGAKVTWTKVSGANGYYVYRKTGTGGYSKIGTVTSGSTVSYTDQTAASGTTYIYTVRAYNGTILSSYDSTGVSLLYLASPALSKAGAAATGVKVTWSKVTGAKGYNVYRKTSGGSYSKIGSVTSGSTLSYTDKTASSNKTYIYTVRAYNGKILSSYYSAGISLLFLKTPALSKVAATTSGLKVTWTKVSGASGYYVYRKTSGGSYSKIGTVKSGSTLSYTDKTVKSGKTYIYTVRAYKGTVTSSYVSAGISALYLASPTLASVKLSTSGLKISWAKVSGASGYYVYRKTGSGSYSKIGTVKSGSTISYTDKTVSSSKTYIYTVRAYKGSVKSSYYTGLSKMYAVYQTYQTTATLYYRSGPGTKYASKGSFTKGTKVNIVKGYSKKADGYTWYKVAVGSKYYYVASKYLKKV